MKLPQTQEELDAFGEWCDNVISKIIEVTGLIIIGATIIALYVHILRILFLL